jgi:Grx4 family monothiol glutaredoxin
MTEITSDKNFIESISSGKTVVHFWADWCQPCSQLDQLCTKLVTGTQIKYIKVEAEKYSNVSEANKVAAVPTFLLFENGKLLNRIEGANPMELTKQVTTFANSIVTTIESKTNEPEDLKVRLESLLHQAKVMLFMKGSPETPKCGFSRQIVQILNDNGIVFSTFDILSDSTVREGLKAHSKWPTYPQLYNNGQLIGGLDIVKQLVEDESLKSSLE